jgi:signal transduction histidine kinase
LTVSNQGDPIRREIIGRIFQPFVRGDSGKTSDGVGLGLYISSQIARAHGGVLEVESTPAETRFTFRMPLKPAA